MGQMEYSELYFNFIAELNRVLYKENINPLNFT